LLAGSIDAGSAAWATLQMAATPAAINILVRFMVILYLV
jgi:hypothetical protein